MVIDKPTAQRFIAAYMHFLGSLLTPEETKGLAVIPLLNKGRTRFVTDRTLLARYRKKHPQAYA
ncbi:hypothetical protein ABXW85_21440, partial [Streptococcus suis]